MNATNEKTGYHINALNTGISEAATAAGALHYRLFDRDGRKTDVFDGEELLDGPNRERVLDAYRKIEEARKLLIAARNLVLESTDLRYIG